MTASQRMMAAMLGNTAVTTQTGTAYSFALNTDSNGWLNYNMRQRIPRSAISNMPGGATNTKIRARFRGATVAGFGITQASVGLAAGSGDAWDYAATPTEMTFLGGSTGATVPTNGQSVSDFVNFTDDGVSALIISYHVVNNAAADDIRAHATPGTGVDLYYKQAANEVMTANVAGYTYATGSDYLGAIDLVEWQYDA